MEFNSNDISVNILINKRIPLTHINESEYAYNILALFNRVVLLIFF